MGFQFEGSRINQPGVIATQKSIGMGDRSTEQPLALSYGVSLPQSSGIPVLDHTVIPLAANGTYTTGAPFDISHYKSIIGVVFAGQPGVLLVEQSWDGVNWDVQSSIEVPALTSGQPGISFEIDVAGILGKLVYTNGAVPQATFRLYAGGITKTS